MTDSLSFQGVGGSFVYSSPNFTGEYYFGTSDFTIEWWQYQTDNNQSPRPWGFWNGAAIVPLEFIIDNGGDVGVSSTVTGYNFIATLNATAYKNKWVHFALVRASGSMSVYMNGLQLGSSYTDTNSYNIPDAVYVGAGKDATWDTANTFGGYIYEFAMTRGTAKYTGPFTPVADLVGDFTINASTTGLGSTNITTVTASPLPSSIVFAGSLNSYVRVPSASALNLTGDFTIEWWQYQTDNNQFPRIWEGVNTNGSSIGFDIEGGDVYLWFSGSPVSLGTLSASAYKNTWVHFAVVRTSGSIQVYKNGVAFGSPVSRSDNFIFDNVSNPFDLYIGLGAESINNNDLRTTFGGYMYNFEWLPGVAKYSGAFTPSTELPANISNYSFIINGSVAFGTIAGTAIFNNTTTVSQTPVYTPPVSTVCLVAGTKVLTDQGYVAIEHIIEGVNTINKKPVVGITRNVTPERFLIRIAKGALGQNVPSEDTVMTSKHKVLHLGKLVEAGTLVLPGVSRVVYNGSTLYNVLQDQYGIMFVNNMIVETLHPDNLLAKIYRETKGKSLEEYNALIDAVNARTINYLQSVVRPLTVA